jgi:hypothetical protein
VIITGRIDMAKKQGPIGLPYLQETKTIYGPELPEHIQDVALYPATDIYSGHGRVCSYTTANAGAVPYPHRLRPPGAS